MTALLPFLLLAIPPVVFVLIWRWSIWEEKRAARRDELIERAKYRPAVYEDLPRPEFTKRPNFVLPQDNTASRKL